MEAERYPQLPMAALGPGESVGGAPQPRTGSLSPGPRAGDIQGHSVRHGEKILPSSISRSVRAPSTLNDGHPHGGGSLLGSVYWSQCGSLLETPAQTRPELTFYQTARHPAARWTRRMNQHDAPARGGTNRPTVITSGGHTDGESSHLRGPGDGRGRVSVCTPVRDLKHAGLNSKDPPRWVSTVPLGTVRHRTLTANDSQAFQVKEECSIAS